MQTKAVSIILLMFGLLINSQAQQTELFPQESLFDSCRADIPLGYTMADKAPSEKAAATYKGVKLVLLSKDKKKGTIGYGYYYIYHYKTPKISLVHLYAANDYESGQMRQPILTQYKPEFDRFYIADCFDKVLAENPQLKLNTGKR